MRVALWGSYDEGNFGDDLMALLLAQACQRAGANVVAYRTPDVLSTKYGIERADTLADLLRGADLCVVGGGEFLFKGAPLKQMVRGYLRRFEANCRQLARAVSGASIPLAAISIGGDGSRQMESLSRGRRELFGSPNLTYASVRLPGDVAVFEGSKAKVEYFPDVLLATSGLIECSTRLEKRRVQIGINLHKKVGRAFVERLHDAIRGRSDVELVLLRSHLPTSGHDYELEAGDVRDVHEEATYTEPLEMVKVLAGLDVVVSSKLHVGVVAMSYGARFISYSGKPKAREFLATVKSPHAYSASSMDLALRAAVASISETHLRSPSESVADAKSAALHHVQTLQRLAAQ